jgi:glycosyltransferase involved in cell wall biosynthesis
MGEEIVKPQLSVIIPAYNEEEQIEQCIFELQKVLDSSKLSNYEIIVVDDGSHDDTYNVLASRFSDNQKIKIASYSPNQGKGYAIKYGFNLSNGEIISFLDADLDLHPSHVLSLYSYMIEHDFDLVIGSKRHPQSVLFYPPLRKIYSNVYYYLIRLFFSLPIKDTQTGVKVFKREVLEYVLPRIVIKQYAFDLELLVVAHMGNYKIGEAPIVLKFMDKYVYTIGIKSICRIIIDTLGIFYRRYIKGSYGRKRKNSKY